NHPRRAGISSLGVGGTNAHVIVEEAPAIQSTPKSKPWQLLVWSAKTKPSLENISSRFADFLNDEKNINLADVAFTLQSGRKEFSHRQILVCNSVSEAAEALTAKDNKKIIKSYHEGTEPSVIFMFPGQGAQYVNMGKGLYKSEKIFREIVDHCAEYLRPYLELDIRELLYPINNNVETAKKLEQTVFTQPALFIIEYALAKILLSFDIKPAAMIGHSIGDYVAACLAGIFSVEDALYIIAMRARLMQKQEPGSMLSLGLSEKEANIYINDEISIAAINSPNLTVLSGPTEKIRKLSEELAELNIDNKLLYTSHAYHSKMMEPALKPFVMEFDKISLNKPSSPFISSLSGTWITNEQATSPDFWASQLRDTVRFSDGIQELQKKNNLVFIELGPGRALSTMVSQHRNDNVKQVSITTLTQPNEKNDDQTNILNAVGKLWLSGLSINWNLIRQNEKRRRVALPTYAFDHQPYWIEPGKLVQSQASVVDPLKKLKNLTDWFSKPVWKKSEFSRFSLSDLNSLNDIWLILNDSIGVGSVIKEKLKSSNQKVITINSGSEYKKSSDTEFIIRIENQADYSEFVRELSAMNTLPTRIIHMWGIYDSDGSNNTASLDHDLNRCFFSHLFLAQALGNVDIQSDLKWISISNGMHKIKDESLISSVKSVSLGPIKTIPREFQGFSCLSLDVDNLFDQEKLSELILSEFNSDFKRQVVAIRNGLRFIRSFEPMDVRVKQDEQHLLKNEGAYIITGGLGGMALALSKGIAYRFKPKLILISRHRLPDKSDWKNFVSAAPYGDRDALNINKLLEIERLGAEVNYFSADVTDEKQMERIFADVNQKYGFINGIIHTAGTIDDGVILFKKKKDALAVLAPKVKGTLILNTLGKKYNSDFLIMFSSASSILAPAGQVDYVAANSFLDAFANANFEINGLKTIAINWGQWQKVGMAARIAQSLGLVEEALQGVKSVHPLLGTKTKHGPEIIEFVNKLNANEFWILNEHQSKQGEYIIPGTGYLEFALASASDGIDEKQYEINDTFFLKPFILKNGEEKDIKVILSKDQDAYEFTILSREDSLQTKWDENAKGYIRQSNVVSKDKVDIESIINRCGSKQPLKENTIDHKHLNFGPRWKNIKELYFGNKEAIAFIELPSEYMGDMNFYNLHPALLDTATGCAQSLAGYDLENELFLPFSYSRINIYRRLPYKFYSHIRYHANENKNTNSAVLDISIYDPEGNLIIDINKFVMMKSNLSDVQISPAGKKNVHQEIIVEGSHNPVNPKSTGNQILQLGQKEGILPSEGSEVFDMILRKHEFPQYIIVSQNIKALYDIILNTEAQDKKISSGETPGESSRPKLSTEFIAPSNDTEKGIAEIWQEILGVDIV
ncbi:MAG TPA: acyltransferase domain-containing protein, partial [Ignavibacteriaceae bacterium]|nr:acyltransferase domain-containing protein [Ignavibacteriaceae bacterium]